MNKKIRIPQLLCCFAIVASYVTTARGAMVTIVTSKDASIFSETDNNNGVGNLYTGGAGVGIRRALLAFNVAGSVPAGSIINSVTLTLTQTRRGTLAVAEDLEIRPLLADWGEGTGATLGTGNAPTPGAVTWNFREFNSNAWAIPGGSFGAASGTALFGLVNFSATTFTSQPAMVADVQNWLNNPSSNFGWMLKYVDESRTYAAREIASRENSIAAWRPQLTVEFTAVPEPNSFVLLGMAAIVMSRYKPRRHQLSQ